MFEKMAHIKENNKRAALPFSLPAFVHVLYGFLPFDTVSLTEKTLISLIILVVLWRSRKISMYVAYAGAKFPRIARVAFAGKI